MVPEDEELKSEIVRAYHDEEWSGHPGAQQTLWQLKNVFYWKGMNEMVEDYVRNCLVCARCKPMNYRAKVSQKHRRASTTWETVALDYMGR